MELIFIGVLPEARRRKIGRKNWLGTARTKERASLVCPSDSVSSSRRSLPARGLAGGGGGGGGCLEKHMWERSVSHGCDSLLQRRCCSRQFPRLAFVCFFCGGLPGLALQLEKLDRTRHSHRRRLSTSVCNTGGTLISKNMPDLMGDREGLRRLPGFYLDITGSAASPAVSLPQISGWLPKAPFLLLH